MNWQPFSRVGSTAILIVTLGCAPSVPPAPSLTLATTTSTRDSGLLDVLIPQFEQQTGIAVRVIAVGSGQALEIGRRGDADVLLTHAPEAEEAFVAAGHARARLPLMHNDFVFVGPSDDPAELQQAATLRDVLTRIAQTAAPFVSRGDQSGTHLKEQSLWKLAEQQPAGAWYVQGGAGMSETLRMANEMQAYTLSDRGTFLSQRHRLDLAILFAGVPQLRNPYAVLVVAPQSPLPGQAAAAIRQAAAAQQFADFLLSPQARNLIAQFGTETFGQPLFFPSAP